MAFPWIFESNFEQGTAGEWDSSHDGEGLLDFPHYSTLAQIPNTGMPWRGAHCMRVQMSDAEEHTVLEGDLNIADTATGWTRFYLWHDLKATVTDTFNIYELQAGTSDIEAAIGLRITATTNAVEIGTGKLTATTFGSPLILPRRWYAIELEANIEDGAAGVTTVYVDQAQYATVTGLTQAPSIQGTLGVNDALATTTGTILFDQFIFDDARVYPFERRWTENVLVTKDQHVLIGPGRINNITLMDGGTGDSVVSIFDTDEADVLDASNFVVELKSTANDEVVDPAGMPVDVERGAYVTLSGTAPRALVQIGRARCWGSEGSIRNYAHARKQTR